MAAEISRIVHDTPAVFTTPQPAADTDSWIGVLQEVVLLARQIAETEFVPRGLRDSVPAVAAAILYGREVGLPPMTALTQTVVVDGRPSLSAEAIRALVLAAGHDLVFAESTGAVCTMRARRRGSEHWTAVTWTLDMARSAGLAGRGAWKSYPRAMLQARATTEICRMVFPDVMHGFRSIEELQDDDALEPEPTKPGTTRVQRASKAPRTPSSPPVAPSPTPALKGPPLPGEPGYDDPPGARGQATPPTAAKPAPAPGQPDSTHVEDPQNPDPPPDQDRPLTRWRRNMIFGLFNELGLTGDDHRDERIALTSAIIGRPIKSSNDLTEGEGETLRATLALATNLGDLHSIVDGISPAQPTLDQGEES